MMLSRRSATLSALAACVTAPHRSWAQPAPAAAGEEAGPVTILRVQRRSIEVNGKPASVLGIRQPDGTPGLITEVGKQFRVHVDNELDVPTLIHWHGLTPPWQQDGVPGVSGPPIPPGASAEYDFPAALRRHVLDAFASGPTRTGAPRGTAHHSRRARLAGSARSGGHAGRFQLHPA